MTVKRPLLTAVETYRQSHVYPLHTPGHKGGRGADPALRHLVGDVALESDVSLMEELDDIHHPEGCIREAEKLAAEVYGSDRCFLGVNGTTGVIHGMLLGALRPGDRILVPRNSHRSVLGGLILAGLEPVYVQPAYDEQWRLILQLSPEQVEAAFARHPDLKAVFLTTPNYFGLAADTKRIAEIAHGHGAVLLVDEAHGPHLGFSDLLPPGAMECGADAAAQSTHKIVGAMTQCSLLQVRYGRLRPEAMEQAMSLVTTTSPNYLLMGALDGARAQLAEKGAAMAAASVRAASHGGRVRTGGNRPAESAAPGARAAGAGKGTERQGRRSGPGSGKGDHPGEPAGHHRTGSGRCAAPGRHRRGTGGPGSCALPGDLCGR
ncbi:aminotransferase class I/II-fold pyridoxal phosphate-dependent enzyme [Acidaminococcus timonensis]|uniref:aminotransferase class I/II-fold pyridoxal phosphate-dependent enzyme n=1 Tax=Acidaminococcus timonensis TaxID=1871002 RepID=UPI000A51DBC9|nr:aminotransferase class I/II-fold pyridoxal phosphate-dependent enzyme [Acidaminococcus timonensis]